MNVQEIQDFFGNLYKASIVPFLPPRPAQWTLFVVLDFNIT